METNQTVVIKKSFEYLKSERDLSKEHVEGIMNGEFIKILKQVLFDPLRKFESGLKFHSRRIEWFGELHYHCFYLGDLLDFIQKKFDISESESNLIVKIMSSLGWIEPLVENTSNFQIFHGLFSMVYNLFSNSDDSLKIDRNQVFKLSQKPKLVIAGGGIGGYTFVKGRTIRDMYDVTVIDSNGTFNIVPLFPFLVKEKELFQHISVNHSRTLPKAKCITGKVSKVDSNQVYYEFHSQSTEQIETESLEFDFLVIGTGCTCRFNIPNPLPENQIKFINCYNGYSILDSHEFIRNSNKQDICIIGGGFVGCEIAGNLAEKYPEKTIHMIQRSERIMKPSDEATSKKVYEIFESIGNVKVHLWSQVISKPNASTFRIENSQTKQVTDIECDVCFLCTGMKPHSDMMVEHFSNSLDSNNLIKINNHFQILDANDHPFHNMFAIGDVTNLKETKLAVCALKHGEKVIQVFKHISNQSSTNSLRQVKEYIPRGYQQGQRVSIGSNNGVWLSGSKLLFSSSYIPWLVESFMVAKGKQMNKDIN